MNTTVPVNWVACYLNEVKPSPAKSVSKGNKPLREEIFFNRRQNLLIVFAAVISKQLNGYKHSAMLQSKDTAATFRTCSSV